MRDWIMVGVLAAAVGLAACEREPDLEQMAEGALKSVALEDEVDATYDEGARVVRLSGSVDSPDVRDKAAEAVRASIGTRAQIANEIVVEGAQERAADDLDSGIEERFENLMENQDGLDGNDVDLRVQNGVVTLSGTARSDAERTKIEGLVRSIPGVTQVVNGVTIDRDRATRADREPARDRDVRGTSGTKKP